MCSECEPHSQWVANQSKHAAHLLWLLANKANKSCSVFDEASIQMSLSYKQLCKIIPLGGLVYGEREGGMGRDMA